MNELTGVEVRIFLYTFLGLQAVLTFAVLRLFNSVVTSNRLILKLKELMGRFESRLMSQEKTSTKNFGFLSSSLNSLSSSVTQLNTSINAKDKRNSETTSKVHEERKGTNHNQNNEWAKRKGV